MFARLGQLLALLSFLCLTSMMGPPLAWASSLAGGGGNLTVLIYHKFGEANYPSTNVSLRRFDEQLAYLRDNQIPVLPLAEAYALLKNGQPWPARAVVLTIDDAYKSTYTGAWPILKKYGFPFTVFLYGKAIEHRYSNYLSWEQIKEMAKAGVDFQDHGYSHFRLASRPAGMDDQAYEEWVVADLVKGRALMVSRLGFAPRFLAYPYGEYNTVVKAAARSLGYEAAFSQNPSSASQFTDFFSVPREPIVGEQWTSMAHFAQVLSRVDLPVAAVTPAEKPFEPSRPVKFCATIRYPDLYQPGTIGVYVSELGWQPAIAEGNRYCTANESKLSRRLNRVAISGRERGSGREAMHYWLLVNPFMPE